MAPRRSPEPFNAFNTIVSVVNNGGGTYTITFSENVNVVSGFEGEAAIILHSASDDHWTTIVTGAAGVSITIVVTSQDGSDDCINAIMWTHPTSIHSTGDPFQVAAPVEIIP